MNLAVFGNIVTSFSWFGVNMLGIGLHRYGFPETIGAMDRAAPYQTKALRTERGSKRSGFREKAAIQRK